MQSTDIPPKFPIPFAKDATGSYIRSIPTTSGDPAAASLTEGFPPNTFVPEGAGGTPPDGRDFNGLLNQITAWSRWAAAGGIPRFDSVFAAAISGYPRGAVLASAVHGDFLFVNQAEGNTTDPDSVDTANWVPIITGNRTVSGSGLVTGGGSLQGDQVLTVTAASQAEVAAGTRTDVAVTPNSLAPYAGAIAGKVPLGRQVVGSGLATGGGDLTVDRAITVPAAVAADVLAGAAANLAMTPKALRDAQQSSLGGNGYQKLESGLIIQWCEGPAASSGEGLYDVTFPIPFPTVCLRCLVTTNMDSDSGNEDVYYQAIGAPTTTKQVVQRQRSGSDPGIPTRPIVMAFGV